MGCPRQRRIAARPAPSPCSPAHQPKMRMNLARMRVTQGQSRAPPARLRAQKARLRAHFRLLRAKPLLVRSQMPRRRTAPGRKWASSISIGRCGSYCAAIRAGATGPPSVHVALGYRLTTVCSSMAHDARRASRVRAECRPPDVPLTCVRGSVRELRIAGLEESPLANVHFRATHGFPVSQD